MNKNLHEASLRLVGKRRNTRSGEVSLSGIGALSDAYKVQAQTRLLLAASIVGWKASLQANGALLSAPLFDCDTFHSGSKVPFVGRIGHGVECELAFLIDDPLPPRPCHGYTKSEVLSHVSGVVPVFEMLESRLVDGFGSSQAHLVADNLGNGGVVLGMPMYGGQHRGLAEIGITVNIDRKVILSKRYTHPAGDPVDVLVALANHLADRGLVLEAGQFVITGSYTPAQKVLPGALITASFDGFNPVTLRVAAEEEPPTLAAAAHIEGASLHRQMPQK
ncbi:hypothetical protein QN219_27370 [Sinorhizobium sp. 7-81]|uniref:2-keto-4-pentenoate hydratase n=1 Tax=Sinorhizobium sp. 8-89 TaxID=3049089 RepID=UPI0024C31972|nr:fumarylacetoacetate hydrolase family protein [Sinorhizobium sp. 8-89]MDK1493714.1 hypothetical protein [Sinorhizobium sp. 8-89]